MIYLHVNDLYAALE